MSEGSSGSSPAIRHLRTGLPTWASFPAGACSRAGRRAGLPWPAARPRRSGPHTWSGCLYRITERCLQHRRKRGKPAQPCATSETAPSGTSSRNGSEGWSPDCRCRLLALGSDMRRDAASSMSAPAPTPTWTEIATASLSRASWGCGESRTRPQGRAGRRGSRPGSPATARWRACSRLPPPSPRAGRTPTGGATPPSRRG
jgi:hypothetical protein